VRGRHQQALRRRDLQAEHGRGVQIGEEHEDVVLLVVPPEIVEQRRRPGPLLLQPLDLVAAGVGVVVDPVRVGVECADVAGPCVREPADRDAPDAVGPFDLGMLAARTGFIAKHRAALIDFLQDYVRAIRWYTNRANRAKALEIISRFTKQPQSVFEDWVLVPGKDYYRDQDGMPDLDMVTANIHVEKELGLVKEDLDAKDYADLGPLKEALAGLK